MLQNSHQQRRDTQGHRTNASNPTGTPASSFSLGRPSPFRPQSSPFLTEHSLTKDQSPPKDRHHPESPITSTFSSSCLVPNITRNHNRTSSVDDYTNVARHDRMTSLFQRARSRTPYSPLEGMNSPKDNPGSPVTPQHSDQATAILRQSHLQRLRERAEEARLELMAYEMMEGDTQVGQERQVLSPILHSVEPEDEESIQTPRPAATQQKSRSELNRHGLVPVDVRTTRSPHTARYQQQTQPVPRATNPLPSWRGSQQSFERIVPLRLETQQIQTRSTISRSQTTPTPTMNLNRGTSERASPATQPLAHRPRSSTIYSRPSLGLRVSPLEVTPSLISPATSPSPPVSPIASATLAAEIHRAICGAVSKESFLHTRHRESGHSTQSGGWRATPKRKIAEKSSYNGDEDEDESDRFLQEHLDNCQEDLRDITLSEILNNQLCLSSDGSDGPYNNGPDSPRDMKPKSPVAADTTIADRTGIFMLAHQGVPSLLSETIPDIDLADLTFMTCQDSEDEDETTPVPPPNYHSQGRGNRILHQLPPMAIPKESILDEFLKSLPPLPHSPMIDGRWPSQQMHLRSGPDAIPNRRFARPARSPRAITPSLSSSSSSYSLNSPTPSYRFQGNERSSRYGSVPLPTPIITSRDRCQQILQGVTGRVDRFQSSVLEMSSSLGINNDNNDNNNNKNFESHRDTPRPLITPVRQQQRQRPLITIPSPQHECESGASTPASAYGSARENFSLESMSDLAEINNVSQRTRARTTNETSFICSSSREPTCDNSAVSSPWTALSPASSNASDSSAGSSWTVGSL